VQLIRIFRLCVTTAVRSMQAARPDRFRLDPAQP
jgi:hypothetical protein